MKVYRMNVILDQRSTIVMLK